MTTAEMSTRLRGTDGYVVESPEGDLGWVEEIWLDEANEPCAVAVRTADGRHGLLLDEQVLAVDREYRWVVVPPEPTLLELDVPRVAADGDGESMLTARWTTTGERFAVSPLRHPAGHAVWRAAALWIGRRRWPLWQVVGAFLVSLALLVAFTITLVYVVAWLLTGTPY